MVSLLQETYRELRPRAPLPDFDLRFYPFANINNTIRLSRGPTETAAQRFAGGQLRSRC